jgi:hypothetical protein
MMMMMMRIIIIIIQLIGINNKIMSFTKKTISYWKTIVRPYAEETLIETEHTENIMECVKGTHYHHCSASVECFSQNGYVHRV